MIAFANHPGNYGSRQRICVEFRMRLLAPNYNCVQEFYRQNKSNRRSFLVRASRTSSSRCLSDSYLPYFYLVIWIHYQVNSSFDTGKLLPEISVSNLLFRWNNFYAWYPPPQLALFAFPNVMTCCFLSTYNSVWNTNWLLVAETSCFSRRNPTPVFCSRGSRKTCQCGTRSGTFGLFLPL